MLLLILGDSQIVSGQLREKHLCLQKLLMHWLGLTLKLFSKVVLGSKLLWLTTSRNMKIWDKRAQWLTVCLVWRLVRASWQIHSLSPVRVLWSSSSYGVGEHLLLSLYKICTRYGWWASSDRVFAKTLSFETNKAAMMSAPQAIPLTADKTEGEKRKAGLQLYARPKSDEGAKKHKPNPDKAVKISGSEFKRRQKAQRCVCGKALHVVCHNKDATPFWQTPCRSLPHITHRFAFCLLLDSESGIFRCLSQ